MGLPWLESLSGFGIGSASAATTAAPPQRFAVLFMGTGISPGRWWAKGAGAGMELSESLAPLEPLKAKINVIDGLFNKAATGQGIHPAMTGNMLSGVPIQQRLDHPRRHHHGPGAGQPDRAGDAAAQHGAGL